MRKILLTFHPIAPILLFEQGDYSVVEKAEPDPLDLSANIGVGKQFFMPYCVWKSFWWFGNSIFLYYRKLRHSVV